MAKGKILVVDDEPDIVKTVSMRLKSSGYDVVTAMDGVQAVEVAMKERPDLIVLDIRMPQRDGHGVATRLRDSTETAFTPIIFLTASTTESDYQTAVGAGASKYITKPFAPEELVAAVEQLLQSGHKRYAH